MSILKRICQKVDYFVHYSDYFQVLLIQTTFTKDYQASQNSQKIVLFQPSLDYISNVCSLTFYYDLTKNSLNKTFTRVSKKENTENKGFSLKTNQIVKYDSAKTH